MNLITKKGATMLFTFLLLVFAGTSYAQSTTSLGQLSGNGGTFSTYLGYAAGSSTQSTAGWNTYVGAEAGSQTTTGGSNTFLGRWAGYANTTGNENVAIGVHAGKFAQTGFQSTYVGFKSGYFATTSIANTCLGAASGENLSTGSYNVLLGHKAGFNSSTGSYNVFIGPSAGEENAAGSRNIYIGLASGRYNNGGERNVFIGDFAGFENYSGSGNVFIGNEAGAREDVNDKLHIANDEDNTIIYGDFATGQVGVNTTDLATGYALSVKGKTITEEVKVRAFSNWPDYVFEEDYELTPLSKLEAQIETLGHLPDVPSAKVVEEEGFELGKMNATLLEKIEGLTLYMIEMDKQMKEAQSQIQMLKAENLQLKTQNPEK